MGYPWGDMPLEEVYRALKLQVDGRRGLFWIYVKHDQFNVTVEEIAQLIARSGLDLEPYSNKGNIGLIYVFHSVRY